MSFTDQKLRAWTDQDEQSRWSGRPRGSGIHCALCNLRFKVGDMWRWVYAIDQTPAFGNFVVCERCDGPDVVERYQAACGAIWENIKHDPGTGAWPVAAVAQLQLKLREEGAK